VKTLLLPIVVRPPVQRTNVQRLSKPLSAAKLQGIHWPNYPCKNDNNNNNNIRLLKIDKPQSGRRPLVVEIWSQSDRVGAKFEQ